MRIACNNLRTLICYWDEPGCGFTSPIKGDAGLTIECLWTMTSWRHGSTKEGGTTCTTQRTRTMVFILLRDRGFVRRDGNVHAIQGGLFYRGRFCAHMLTGGHPDLYHRWEELKEADFVVERQGLPSQFMLDQPSPHSNTD